MNLVNKNLIVRVMRGMSLSLDESSERMSLLSRLIARFKNSISENNIAETLTYFNLIQTHIKESSNEETLKIIMDKLVENETIPSAIVNYDLTSPKDFIKAMEDEIIREMVSGAAIGGRFDGAQTNSAANATGMAAPNSPSKKKKNRIDAVLISRFR